MCHLQSQLISNLTAEWRLVTCRTGFPSGVGADYCLINCSEIDRPNLLTDHSCANHGDRYLGRKITLCL
jgi:hypothetical protein